MNAAAASTKPTILVSHQRKRDVNAGKQMLLEKAEKCLDEDDEYDSFSKFVAVS